MSINAFKDGLTPFSAATMNPLLNLQPFAVIYEGTLMHSPGGSGVLETSIASYTIGINFTPTFNNLSRIELHLDKDGEGSDLEVQIRQGSTADGSTLLKKIVVPKEFIPVTAAYVSIPVDLIVTPNAMHWIFIPQVGDTANKIDIVGEITAISGYQSWRKAGGTWELINPLHYRIYSGSSGLPVHVIEGVNSITTIEYSSGLPSKLYQYIPPSDGPAGGIRDVLTLSYSGGLPIKGV